MSDIEQLRGRIEALRLAVSTVTDHFVDDFPIRQLLAHEIMVANNEARANNLFSTNQKAIDGFADELDTVLTAMLKDD